MGTPMADEIIWICDVCKKRISKDELSRPNPNKYEVYHKECISTKINIGELK